MKNLLLLIFITFATSIYAQEGDIYVCDFSIDYNENSNLGRSIANEFERLLDDCKNKYQITTRAHARPLLGNAKTLEEKFELLKGLGVEYVITGVVSSDKISGSFILDYAFEELATGQYIFHEEIVFPNAKKIENSDARLTKIKNSLSDVDLCKKHLSINKEKVEKNEPNEPTPNVVIINHKPNAVDTDGDGIPDTLDKEVNSPKNTLVDRNGVAIQENTNSNDELKSTKEEIEELFPSLPSVQFEGKTAIPSTEYVKLHQIAFLIKRYPLIKVIITGTDSENPTLASTRAKMIKEYFIKNYKFSTKQFVLKHRLSDDERGVVLFEVSKEELDWNDF